MSTSRVTLAGFAATILITTLCLPGPGSAECGPLEKSLSQPDAVPIGLDDSRSFHGGDELLALDIPETGVVGVEVTVPISIQPGSAPVEPVLTLESPGCLPHVVLERSIYHILFVAEEPGTRLVRVGAQDPLLDLGTFEITTRFMPLEQGPILSKGDPDPEIIEIDPSGLRVDEARPCRADDHGSTFLCAARIHPGQKALGQLDGPPDAVFYLFLDGPSEAPYRTITITTAGGVDSIGILYDHDGHRLAFDDDSGDAENFRIVKALAPGRYYLRITGHPGTTGTYELDVTSGVR